MKRQVEMLVKCKIDRKQEVRKPYINISVTEGNHNKCL